MKKLLITHIDLDGISPVVLLEYYEYKFDEIVFRNYFKDTTELTDEREIEEINKEKQDLINKINTYDSVLITDFSLPADMLEKVNDNVQITILDHHESAKEILHFNEKENMNITVDTTRCGTKLVLDEIIKIYDNKATVEFVELVDVYDRWVLESEKREKSENLNRLFWESIDYKQKKGTIDCYSIFITDMLQNFRESKEKDISFEFNQFDYIYIDRSVKKEQNALKKALSTIKTRKDSKGHYFSIVRGTSKASFVCSEILKKYNKLDYIIFINDYFKTKKEGKMSVRIKEGRDLVISDLNSIKGHDYAGGVSLGEQYTTDLFSGKIYELGYKE